MEYTWKVTKVKVDNSVEGVENAIFQTFWECDGTDARGTGKFSGATPFKQVDLENFTPFSELTEEMVISWIKAEVDSVPGYREHINAQIEKQIVASIKVVEELEADALPWANS